MQCAVVFYSIDYTVVLQAAFVNIIGDKVATDNGREEHEAFMK